jgi:hypothetical protein
MLRASPGGGLRGGALLEQLVAEVTAVRWGPSSIAADRPPLQHAGTAVLMFACLPRGGGCQSNPALAHTPFQRSSVQDGLHC